MAPTPAARLLCGWLRFDLFGKRLVVGLYLTQLSIRLTPLCGGNALKPSLILCPSVALPEVSGRQADVWTRTDPRLSARKVEVCLEKATGPSFKGKFPLLTSCTVLQGRTVRAPPCVPDRSCS